jgi:hypothetical protein
MTCTNDLKFRTKISCLNLHQMVHLSGKNIFQSHHAKKPQLGLFNAQNIQYALYSCSKMFNLMRYPIVRR